MSHPEFKKFNELQITITGFCVNTPEDKEELLTLLNDRDTEVRRLAKVFGLEHLLEGKVTWNLEVNKATKKGTDLAKVHPGYYTISDRRLCPRCFFPMMRYSAGMEQCNKCNYKVIEVQL